MSNYILVFLLDVITDACPNFNIGSAEPPLKLGHASVIT